MTTEKATKSEDEGAINIWEKAGDTLGRKATADYLTRFFSARYGANPDEPGYVLAVNADWGMGKTFLLETWAKELQFLGFPAVYFDAWKNDFTPDPLIAFIAQVDAELVKQFTGTKVITPWRAAVGAMEKFIKPAAKVAASIAAKRLANLTVDEIKNLLDGTNIHSSWDDADKRKDQDKLVDGLADSMRSAMKKHQDRSKAIHNFKEKLTVLVTAIQEKNLFQLPIVFFVDELDRCRPNYAIELLEGIKHLFGVPGIYFVVGLNTPQLGEATRAIYGPTFKGEEYLKRFFDQEYRLPEPDHLAYSAKLFDEASIPHDRLALILSSPTDFSGANQADIFEKVGRIFSPTLRSRRRVIRLIEAAIISTKAKHIHVFFLYFLAFLYEKNSIDFGEFTSQQWPIHRIAASLKLNETLLDISTGRMRDNQQITIRNILDMYITKFRQTYSEIHNDFNGSHKSSNFPNSLLFDLLITEAVENNRIATHLNDERSSISHYPDLIRHAGQFLTPPSKI